MKIIISPAKKMVDHQEAYPYETTPLFLQQAKKLHQHLKRYDQSTLQQLLNCNDKLVELNYHRYQSQNIEQNLSCALTTYVGLQYQHMAPHLFTQTQWDYVKDHLWILSGLYGVLRPQDGIMLYRLEMQTKPSINKTKSLYDFWKPHVMELVQQEQMILNLASKEYSDLFSFAKEKMIDVVFMTEDKGKLKVKGTLAKMARGSLVRYMAENQVSKIDEIKQFNDLGFTYCKEESSDRKLVFVKRSK